MQDILLNQSAGVLTITFNRAGKKNSFTAAMYTDMVAALENAAGDDQVRAVVFQGSQEAFSAGNDIDEFISNPPVEPDAPVWQFIRVLSTFPKPVVAAVNGVVVGIGATMLLHCDLVYAATDARFRVPFVNLGVCPEAGSSLLLQKIFGYRNAAEALLLGGQFSAEEALNGGLVTRLLPPNEVLAYARQEAANLADKPVSALMETKRLLKSHDAETVSVRIEEETRLFQKMVTQPAAREAFAAFGEKRRPDFRKVGQ
ncbi:MULTISPECIES: enoyl-CoA hydratase [Paraburkholderia]|uniref:Enoyl-CoA hydratase n=1 Tax=Paraburkholderia dioscoreae TaxID=2604047 RepID=A0A5Q4Z5Z5_9BURK|nr:MULTISPECIES: enoyl-CoA hydratase [Paraburkholderia]MDR8397093.1 enoyl-CoA hydratase [Paraburkholderia sp. USG1]VVD27527.1 Enoyl-CoA hydratase [Paraburkholderia dioscoreae]